MKILLDTKVISTSGTIYFEVFLTFYLGFTHVNISLAPLEYYYSSVNAEATYVQMLSFPKDIPNVHLCPIPVKSLKTWRECLCPWSSIGAVMEHSLCALV